MLENIAVRCAAVLCLAVLCQTPQALRAQHSHGQHQHGVSHLNMAVEGNRMEITLEVPGADIVGFEHAPDSDADRQTIARAIDGLERGGDLFALPEAARCRPVDTHAEFEHEGEGHAAFHGHYRFVCDEPQRIEWIEIRLFDRFAGMRKVEARAITPRGQFSAELTPVAARLML